MSELLYIIRDRDNLAIAAYGWDLGKVWKQVDCMTVSERAHYIVTSLWLPPIPERIVFTDSESESQ